MTGTRRIGEAALGLALLFGIFQSGCCLRFEVKDESTNKTCILADLFIDFVVEYKSGDKQAKANFSLPDSAVVDKNSSCGTKTGSPVPILVIAFASGNSLAINFTKSDTEYKVDGLVFAYNLSNAALFPGSSENGTKQVSSRKTDISAKSNQFYQCSSSHLITMGNVNATLHGVKLEAYLNGNNYSTNASVCKEDFTPTPSPQPVTPTETPIPPKTPDIGTYRVNDTSGKPCLLARMGLQLNITYKKQDDKNASIRFNIVPNEVKPSGNCSDTSAVLTLSSAKVSLQFTFTMNKTESKSYLSHVQVNTTIPDAKEPKINVDSGSLSFLQATAGKSYKCNTKQTFQITDNFSIDTYRLQVQAFDMKGDNFGPAVECADDQNSMLVPIVVGAALAGLVLIVLIAYLIGRKRSHAGYQTI